MDISEVKACLRALLSSSAISYSLKSLLNEFRNTTGFDLPLFGCKTPVDFLSTLTDTVQLFGDYFNPVVALVRSEKSSHITSLVDRQRNKKLDNGSLYGRSLPRRLILPSYVQEPPNFSSNRYYPAENYSSDMQNNYRQINDHRQNIAVGSGNHSSLMKPEGQRKNHTIHSKVTQNCHPPKDQQIHNQASEKLPQLNAKFQKVTKDFPKQLPEATNPLPTQNELGYVCDFPKTSQGNSQETEKADSCYFEDNESCPSIENCKTSSHSYINDGMKNKLQTLIKKYPDGLWCCELPDSFLKEYNVALDYREYGFTSLIQMLSELQDVFRCIRPGNEDWIIFDASKAPSEREKKMIKLQENGNIANDVANNIHKLLLKRENKTDAGVQLTDIPHLYKAMYGTPLDFQSLGFPNLKSFLETCENTLFNIYEIDKKYIVRPMSKTAPHSSIPWKEALPPITKDNDIFKEIFPNDVVGPEGKYPVLDLSLHIAIGQRIEVCIAEIWSPGEFCLQLNKFKKSRDRFAVDLQNFYNTHLNKYKMPDSTIVPLQLCVGLYSDDPENPDEWNRAQILKVVNERIVIVEFVDYGTVARVRKTQLRFLHRNFQSFPVQAFSAELYRLAPKEGDAWSMKASRKFLELSQVPSLEAELIDIDFKKPLLKVVLYDPSHKSRLNVNKQLVVENLARFLDPITPEVEEPENSKMNGSKEEDIAGEFSEASDLESDGGRAWFRFKMKSPKGVDAKKVDKELAEEVKSKGGEIVDEFEDVPDWDKVDENPKSKAPVEKEKTDLFDVKDDTPLIKQTTKPKQPEEPTKRLPPGLERMIDLNRFQMMNLQQPDDIKKKINILAIELLTTNATVKQVAVQDPSLALKIATEMAEVYIRSMCYDINPFEGKHFLGRIMSDPSYLLPLSLPMPFVVPPPPVCVVTSPKKEMKPPNTPKVSPAKPENQPPPPTSGRKYNHIQTVTIAEKTIHVVNINAVVYFFAEELIRIFSTFKNRDVADRILHLKNVVIEYKILNKTNGPQILTEIKSCDIPGVVKKKSKKWNVYLVPIGSVVSFLKGLGCETDLFVREIISLEKPPVAKTSTA